MSRKTNLHNDWPMAETLSDAEKLHLVRMLPAPDAGVVVNVPLMLLPLYMQLYQIEPRRYTHPVLNVKKQEL